MSVVVVGLHERDTPLELLEMVAVAEADIPKALGSLLASPHLSEVVLLSTCLRTEVYAVVERFHDGLADLQAFFHARIGTSAGPPVRLAGDPEVRLGEQSGTIDLGTLSCWYEDAAVLHLFEVAAGIDSPIL